MLMFVNVNDHKMYVFILLQVKNFKCNWHLFSYCHRFSGIPLKRFWLEKPFHSLAWLLVPLILRDQVSGNFTCQGVEFLSQPVSSLGCPEGVSNFP